ncbi:hypothetical protein [Pelagibacterium mangrovi]|uniref:hypothetical protein n=1 Tax=Pelagibacterium mangrovi TaxID=3119828 RepID=UPI002FCAB411
MTQIGNVQAETNRKNLTQALQIGASLQVFCILLPLLDLWIFGGVERHVRAAYPEWTPDQVTTDRNAIIAYLVGVGFLLQLGWLFSLAAAHHGRRERAVVTTVFVIAMCWLTFNAGIGGGGYDNIIPLWLGLILLLVPALPGITAMMVVWQRKG